MPTNLTTATEFVLSHASREDLSRIGEAIKQRRVILGTIAAASVATGSSVRLDGLSPKYLNGLTGTVKTLDAKSAAVELDETSTEKLRWDGFRKYTVPDDTKRYLLRGVPLSCCHTPS